MGRIKMFGAMARLRDVSPQEFHDHYRHPHGTMGVHISTLREYVQSHQFHTDLLGSDQNRFEAVAELWFDNRNDSRTLRIEATMVAYLNEDEPRFLDLPETKVFVGEEEVLVSCPGPGHPAFTADSANAQWRLFNRPLSIKLIQFIGAAAGAQWCTAEDEHIGNRLGAYRHVRCHPPVSSSIAPGRAQRPREFIGVRELWWPTLTAFQQAVAADQDAWNTLMAGQHVHTLLAQAERWR